MVLLIFVLGDSLHLQVWDAAAAGAGGGAAAPPRSRSVLQLRSRAPGERLLSRALSGHCPGADSAVAVNGCALCASPAGLRALSASDDCTLRLCAGDGTPLRVLSGHAAAVLCCAIAPDGLRAVSGSKDGVIKVRSR